MRISNSARLRFEAGGATRTEDVVVLHLEDLELLELQYVVDVAVHPPRRVRVPGVELLLGRVPHLAHLGTGIQYPVNISIIIRMHIPMYASTRS